LGKMKRKKKLKSCGREKVAVWQDGRRVVEMIFKLLSNGHSLNITNLNQAFNAWDFEEISG